MFDLIFIITGGIALVVANHHRDGTFSYTRVLVSVSAIYVSCRTAMVPVHEQFPDGHADGAVRSAGL